MNNCVKINIVWNNKVKNGSIVIFYNFSVELLLNNNMFYKIDSYFYHWNTSWKKTFSDVTTMLKICFFFFQNKSNCSFSIIVRTVYIFSCFLFYRRYTLISSSLLKIYVHSNNWITSIFNPSMTPKTELNAFTFQIVQHDFDNDHTPSSVDSEEK